MINYSIGHCLENGFARRFFHLAQLRPTGRNEILTQFKQKMENVYFSHILQFKIHRFFFFEIFSFSPV
jgi:hypothetical protein